MKCLVVYNKEMKEGMGDQLLQEVRHILGDKGHSIQPFEVEENETKMCLGCFGCWIKKPGTCLIKDRQDEFSKHYIENDVVILLTKIKYGTYEPTIKNLLDRNIALILPYFGKFKGETHHTARYKKYPQFVAMAYGEDFIPEEVETFKGLVEANAINFRVNKGYTIICEGVTQIGEATQTFIQVCEEIEGGRI